MLETHQIDEEIISGIEKMLPLEIRNEICRKVLVYPDTLPLIPNREIALFFMFALPIPTFLELYAHALELNLRDAQDANASQTAKDGIKRVRNELFTIINRIKNDCDPH